MLCVSFYNDVSTPRVGLARLGYRPSGRVGSGSGIIAFVIQTKGRQPFSKLESHLVARNNCHGGFRACRIKI